MLDVASQTLTREQQRVLNVLLAEGMKIPDPHVRSVFNRAAIETGLVESGLTNPSGGDADSAGWRQERASLYPNPTNLRASAARFRQEFLQAYRPGLRSYNIAAAVQRPAAQYRGRYHDVAHQAAAILRAYSGSGSPVSPGSSAASLTAPSPGPSGSVDPGQSADATALINLLSQRQQRPAPASTPLPIPAAVAGPAKAGPAISQAYQALSSGQGPAPKQDIGALLALVQTPGQGSGGAVSAAGAPVAASAPSVGGQRLAAGISPRARPGDPVVSRKQSVGGLHDTMNLPGYPAHDYFAPAGSHAVAPVTGTIIRLSGHDPANGPANGPHGPLGWSVYIKGSDGRTYYLTHMGSRNVKVGQKVKQGQIIGTVANYDKYGTPSHIHMGIHG
jgi:murein DD-endopeptidase MepM/ murein hydrolase activator NlpD